MERGVLPPVRRHRGAVDRVDGTVRPRAVSGGDVLAVEQHQGVVLLPLPDHDHAVELDRAEEGQHASTAAPFAASLSPLPIQTPRGSLPPPSLAPAPYPGSGKG